MAIKSMTGFARAQGSLGAHSWSFEARSINSRGLDLRMRLPPGYEALEPLVRDVAAKHITRGAVTITLLAERQDGSSEVRINEALLAQVLEAAETIERRTGRERAGADGLLALRGVLEVVERSEEERETQARFGAMLATLDSALAGLIAARQSEGARLKAVLRSQLAEIERLTSVIEVSPARAPEMVAQRLREQVTRLIEVAEGLDAARLHQEAVLLATRSDVEEELQRLKVHITAARELLEENGAVGRKFEFLAQEFNREANTLCAKSNDVGITQAGLAMKVLIDQMREQVQNIE